MYENLIWIKLGWFQYVQQIEFVYRAKTAGSLSPFGFKGTSLNPRFQAVCFSDTVCFTVLYVAYSVEIPRSIVSPLEAFVMNCPRLRNNS